MSHWFHRNPLKATVRHKFDLGVVATSVQARKLLSDATIYRNKLLEMLENPSNSTELVKQACDQYLGVLLGFTEEIDGKDNPLRYSLTFRWTQSLSSKGDVPLHAADAVFELINMMINVAIWLTKHAAKLSAAENVNLEDAKEIHKSLRAAAGIFNDMRSQYVPKLGAAVTNNCEDSDLSDYILEAYLNQCTAEAQEVAMARAIELEHSPSTVSSLAFETSRMYEQSALALANLNDKVVGKWKRYLEFKQLCYKAYAYCYHGELKLAEEKSGEAVTTLKEAIKYYQESELKAKEYSKTPGPGMTAKPQEHLFFRKLQPLLQRTYDKCVRENNFIFHQKVPDNIPLLQLKAAYGLAAPESYQFPEVIPEWIGARKGFDITKLAWKYGSNEEKAKDDTNKKAEEAPIPPVKEEPIYSTDKDPKNQSGCVIS